MKYLLAALMLFVSACTFTIQVPESNMVSSATPKYDVEQVFKSVAKISVNVKDGTGSLSGSAFAISDDYLLTAAHVCVAIAEYQDMGVLENKIYLTTLGRGDQLVSNSGVEIKEVDEAHDICLVKMEGHGLTPLKFVSDYEKEVKFRTKVWVVGAPSGMPMTSEEGKVMDPNMKGRVPLNGKLLVSSAATGGNSGGPVINERGEIVGILVMGHSTYDHLSICVRAPVVQRFLKLVGM